MSKNESALKQDTQHEYTLVDESCWITVGNVSVHIVKHKDAVDVRLYPAHGEDGDPLESVGVLFDDAKLLDGDA